MIKIRTVMQRLIAKLLINGAGFAAINILHSNQEITRLLLESVIIWFSPVASLM